MNNSDNVNPNTPVDYEAIIKNCSQNSELYTKLSEENKQEFWNVYFNKIVWYNERGTQLPVSISVIKEKYKFESNFDRFIPGIMRSLEEEGFTGTIDDIFVLDNEAKIFFDNRIIENLGDLYYNTLSEFLEKLYNVTGYEKLKGASEKIKTAWTISEPYVDKNNPPKKHENAELEIRFSGGIKVISQKIGNLDNAGIKDFLLKISQKIWSDGEKDSNRPSIGKDGVVDEMKKRTKLATVLLEASLLLKETAEGLEKKD